MKLAIDLRQIAEVMAAGIPLDAGRVLEPYKIPPDRMEYVIESIIMASKGKCAQEKCHRPLSF